MQQQQDKDSYIRELEQKKQNDINELTKIKDQMEDLIYQSPEVQQLQQSQNQIPQQNSDFQQQSISQRTQSKRSLNVENDEEQTNNLYSFSGVDSGVKKGRSGCNISQILKLESINVSPSLLNSYTVQIGEIINSLVKEKNEFRISGIYQQMQEKVKFYQNSFFLDLIEQVEQKNQKDLTPDQKKLKEDMVNSVLQDQEQIAEWKYGEKVEIRILNQRKISKIRLNGKYNEIPEEIFKKLHELEKQIYDLNKFISEGAYTLQHQTYWTKEQTKQLDELKQVVLTMRYCWLFKKKSKIFFSTLQKYFQQLVKQKQLAN